MENDYTPLINKRLKKTIVLIGLFATLCLFGIIFFLSNSKIELSKISADNYVKLLVVKQSSILRGTRIDNFFPDKFAVTMAHDFSNSDNFRGNGLKVSNQKFETGNLIEITSYRSGIHYSLSFNNQSLDYAWIFKNGLLDERIPKTPLIKKMILDLIINDGFLLKKTELKSGSDIIIKETDQCFIIGVIDGEFNSELYPPQSISFMSYWKTKYFNSLRLSK